MMYSDDVDLQQSGFVCALKARILYIYIYFTYINYTYINIYIYIVIFDNFSGSNIDQGVKGSIFPPPCSLRRFGHGYTSKAYEALL